MNKHRSVIVGVLLLAGCNSEGINQNPPPPPLPPPPITDPVGTISPLAARWSELPNSPTSPSGHFQDVWFINASEGWVVSLIGDVHHTIDGGVNWETLRTGSNTAGSPFFRAVTFVSPTLGWVGDLNNFNNPTPGRALWETRDGGRTFENISNRITGVMPTGICGLYSVDATTIYGVGRWHGPAAFIKSTDGGATWQSKSLAPLMTGAVDIHFFDRQRGIIAGARGVGSTPAEQTSSRTVIAMTTDGGETWTERFVGSGTGQWSWKISFPTPLIGYVAVQGPSTDMTVLKTTDGGTTWTEIKLGISASGWGSAFISESTGWITGGDAAWETTDGGARWKKSLWTKGQSVNRVRILPSGVAYAAGSRVFKLAPP